MLAFCTGAILGLFCLKQLCDRHFEEGADIMADNKKKVTVRLLEKTVFEPKQAKLIGQLIEKADFVLGDIFEFGQGGTQTQNAKCKEHSCSGYKPGGGTDDCVAKHSSCKSESCAPNQCSGHNCDTEACKGQKDDNGPSGCYPQNCGTNAQGPAEVQTMMSKMMAASPEFAALAKLQREIKADNISLSIDA